MINNFTVKK